MNVSPSDGWLLLVFRLPTRQASARVEIWRRLRRAGALALPSSGYVLPDTPATHERFEWLAAAIRRARGEASVIRVRTIDNLPDDRLRETFVHARTRDYEALAREVKTRAAARTLGPGPLTRLRRRFQDIAAIDYFDSPWRERVHAQIERAAAADTPRPARRQSRARGKYQGRLWVTRPRPGIDRVSSAWLIRRFIDPAATFGFLDSAGAPPAGSVPFDTFLPDGFGHRGDDCTFETLCASFAVRDARVVRLARMIHDADLGDEKFARPEGAGLDRVLVGWAGQGVSDEELLRRGMQMIDGLYESLSEAPHDR